MPRAKIDEIKITGVHFRPTWHWTDEDTKHTVLADCYIDVESLPKEMQVRLVKFITKAYKQHIETTRVQR